MVMNTNCGKNIYILNALVYGKKLPTNQLPTVIKIASGIKNQRANWLPSNFLAGGFSRLRFSKKVSPNAIKKNGNAVNEAKNITYDKTLSNGYISSAVAIPQAINTKNIKFNLATILMFFNINFIHSIINLIIPLFRNLMKIIMVMVVIFKLDIAMAEEFTDNKLANNGSKANTYIKQLIRSAEVNYGIPSGLLQSIAEIESGFKPFVLCLKGRAIYPKTKEEAISIINELTRIGERNIDIGVMQINYHWHAKEFASIEDMLDVDKNIDYSARLLTTLYVKYKSWHKAVRYYHSANSEHYKIYSRKIIVAWVKQKLLLTNQET